jgi:predicted patatin/cPLA2 family phospholipase
MDGGLVDSVPIRKSIHDGNSKHVLVLTRPKGYRKKPAHFTWLARLRYPKYEGLCAALANRPMVYNNTMDFLDELEEKGEVFVIRPESDLNVGRAERNKDKLFATYDTGFTDASACREALSTYLQDTTSRVQ